MPIFCPQCGCVGFVATQDILLEQPDKSLKAYQMQMCSNCRWSNAQNLIIQNGGLLFYEPEETDNGSDLATDQDNEGL